MASSVLNRVIRRETHSSRTAPTVIVLVVVIFAALFLGIELVLFLLDRGALLASPGTMLSWLMDVPKLEPRNVVIAVSLVVGIVGLLLVWAAISPGRLTKHQLAEGSHSVIIDNGVIASAIAERVSRELNVPKKDVIVGVGHHHADVTVRARPEYDIDPAQIKDAAQKELAEFGMSPTISIRAKVRAPSRSKEPR